MIRPEDVVPLTEFHRKSAAFMRRLKKDGRPILLTVNGRAAAVIASPQSYEHLTAQAERAEIEAALTEALREADQGKTRPIDEVFDELDAKYFGADGKPKRRRKSA